MISDDFRSMKARMARRNWKTNNSELAISILYQRKIHRIKEEKQCYSNDKRLIVNDYMIRLVSRKFPNRLCFKCIGKELRKELKEWEQKVLHEIRIVFDKTSAQLNYKDYMIEIPYKLYTDMKDLPWKYFKLNSVYADGLESWKFLYEVGDIPFDKQFVKVPLIWEERENA